MGQKTIANMTIKIAAETAKFRQGMKDAKRSMDGLKSTISSFKAIALGAFSVVAIKNFVSSSIKAYGEQELAEAKLLKALGGREDMMQRLASQAFALQKKTMFGDEKTIEAQAQLAVVLKDNEDAIRSLIPLVQDMATAMNMDLVSASQLVAKTLGSSTNSLARYGIQVDGAVGSSERLASMMDALTGKFLGQAKAAGDTLTGQIEKLKNAWGDFKEEVGKFILTDIIDLEEWRAFFEVMSSGVSSGKKWIVAFGDIFPKKAEKIVKSVREMNEAQEELNGSIAKFRKEFGAKGGDYQKEIKSLQTLREELKDLKEQRETADLSAVSGFNKKIEKLEKEIKTYEELGKAIDLNTEKVMKNLEMIQGIGAPDFSKKSTDSLYSFGFEMDEETFNESADVLVEQYNEILERTRDFTMQFKATIQDGIAEAFEGIGEIVGSFVAGDTKSAMDTVYNLFASFASKLGKLFISFGVASLAFAQNLKTAFTNPANAVALISAGAALVGIGAVIRSMARSGVGRGYEAGSQPAGVLMPSRQSIQLQGKLQGKDILLSASRYNQTMINNT